MGCWGGGGEEWTLGRGIYLGLEGVGSYRGLAALLWNFPGGSLKGPFSESSFLNPGSLGEDCGLGELEFLCKVGTSLPYTPSLSNNREVFVSFRE